MTFTGMADALSLLRLGIAFFFPWALAQGGLLPVVLFALAAVTDYADGPIARRTGTASPEGGVLDNVADIAFVLGAATAGVRLGLVSWVGPLSIGASVATYAIASRRLVVEQGEMQLARSRIGHAAGVVNYVLAGTLAFRQAMPALVPLEVVTFVGWGTAAVNLAAASVRVIGR